MVSWRRESCKQAIHYAMEGVGSGIIEKGANEVREEKREGGTICGL